ncbi:MAG: PIN domain-containing protein [Candidatus Methanodesulfokora sp.]|jgi:predicted nucleic-acid-binding protein
MRNVMIDTEIWSIAKKRPLPNNFSSKEDYLEALNAHEAARKFFLETLPSLKVYISAHQLAEIYHVLAFRGARLSREQAASIVLAILEDDDIVKVPVTQRHVEEAVKESKESGIHVWDYICFLPVKDYVDAIFSCDLHFRKIGEKHKIEVINPIGLWLLQ